MRLRRQLAAGGGEAGTRAVDARTGHGPGADALLQHQVEEAVRVAEIAPAGVAGPQILAGAAGGGEAAHHVALHRLVAGGDGGEVLGEALLEQQVGVAVDQAGNDRAARQVDHRRPLGNGEALPHLGDAAAADQDVARTDHAAGLGIEQVPGADEGFGLGRRLGVCGDRQGGGDQGGGAGGERQAGHGGSGRLFRSEPAAVAGGCADQDEFAVRRRPIRQIGIRMISW